MSIRLAIAINLVIARHHDAIDGNADEEDSAKCAKYRSGLISPFSMLRKYSPSCL